MTTSPADAIIHHASVRSMLLLQKAVAEGGRSMLYECAMVADLMQWSFLMAIVVLSFSATFYKIFRRFAPSATAVHQDPTSPDDCDVVSLLGMSQFNSMAMLIRVTLDPGSAQVSYVI